MLGEYSQKRNRKIPPPHGPEPCDFKTALNGDFDSRSSGYAIFTGDYFRPGMTVTFPKLSRIIREPSLHE